MIIERLSEILKPWLRQKTWTSTHWADSERFNIVLHDAITSMGAEKVNSYFEEAVSDLIDELYPDYSQEHKEQQVHRCMLKVETVIDYLRDNKLI